MLNVLFYSLISVFVVSLVSFVGVLTLAVNQKKLKSILLYLVSFSAGALFGDAFIHLLPEAFENHGFGLNISIWILLGIIFFFIVEKFVHWRHCHAIPSKEHIHPFAITNLFGDALHNFIDGLIIAGSYLVSIPVGVATTIAVVLHEIPQEIGDFGVLLQGGFTRAKALLLNFLVALTSVLGTIIGLLLSFKIENLTSYLIPFAAGGFIYIAGSDLIPELHKEVKISKSIVQLLMFLFGILIMIGLVFLE